MQLSFDNVVNTRLIYLNFIAISWGLKLSNWLIKTSKQDYKNFIKSYRKVFSAGFLKLLNYFFRICKLLKFYIFITRWKLRKAFKPHE